MPFSMDSHVMESIAHGSIIPEGLDQFVSDLMQEFDDNRIGQGGWLRPTEILALRLKNNPNGYYMPKIEGWDPLDPNPQGQLFFSFLESKLDEQNKSMLPVLVQAVYERLPKARKAAYFSNFDVGLPSNPTDWLHHREGYSRPWISAGQKLTDSTSITSKNKIVAAPRELRHLQDFEQEEYYDSTLSDFGDVSVRDLVDSGKSPVGIAAPIFGNTPAPRTFESSRKKDYSFDLFHPSELKKVETLPPPISNARDAEIVQWWELNRNPMPVEENRNKHAKPKIKKETRAQKREKSASLVGMGALARLALRKG